MKLQKLVVRTFVLFLVILGIQSVTPSISFAESYLTYYVDGEQGLDTNDGLSWATAFRTIKKGVDTLNWYSNQEPPPARQLLIAEGDYWNLGYGNKENLIIASGLRGTADSPVVIRGIGNVNIYGYEKEYDDYNKGEEYELNRYTVAVKDEIIEATDWEFVWVVNLGAFGATKVVEIDGLVDGGTHHIAFEGCRFGNAKHYSTFIKGYHSHNFYFFNNRWLGNLNAAYETGFTHHMYFNAGKSGWDNAHDVYIVGNEFKWANRWAVQFNAAHVSDVVVSRNVFGPNHLGGLQFIQVTNLLVENNLFFESGRTAIVGYMENANYYNQTNPPNPAAPPRAPETLHDITIRNNTIYARGSSLYEYQWWNACPGSNSHNCWNYKDEASCLSAPDDCYWFEPTNPKQCSSNGVPYGLGCYKDEPKWEGGTTRYSSGEPSIKLTMDTDLIGIVVPYYNITIENNIISSPRWGALTWERSDANCAGCNNLIKNNLLHKTSSGNVYPGFNIWVPGSTEPVDWFYPGENTDLYPELFVDNLTGDPRYASSWLTPTVYGLFGKGDEHDPTPIENWVNDYISDFPPYLVDPRYDYSLNHDSVAIDAASNNYPGIDFYGVKRPIGDYPDVGAIEFVKDDCPDDPNKTGPGVCGCGTPDTDTDLDGTADCIDGCPGDKYKIKPGVCGCGILDIDSDKDGVMDCLEDCVDDPNKTEPGVCGCGVADVDSDGDSAMDCVESCPEDPNKIEPGLCGCGIADTDSDGDGVPDCLEAGIDPPDNGDDGDDGDNGDNNDEWEAAKAGGVAALKAWKKAVKKYRKRPDKLKKVKKARKNALKYFNQTAYMQGTLESAYALQMKQIKKGTARALKSKADEVKRKKLCKKVMQNIMVLIGLLS